MATTTVWGWNAATKTWVKVQVDVNGRVVVTTTP